MSERRNYRDYFRERWRAVEARRDQKRAHVVRDLGRLRLPRMGSGLCAWISAAVVPMTAKSFVVHLIGSDDPKPFKHFELHHSAAAYARERVAAGDADRADNRMQPGLTDQRKTASYACRH
jgi:hypothetical protein